MLERSISRLVAALSGLAILLSAAVFSPRAAAAGTALYKDLTPPPLAVQSAVLMDADSGVVLYALDPDRAEPPASLTKMMTADLTLEAVEARQVALSDVVPVSAHAWKLAKDTQVSRMFIQPGLPVTVDQLLYGLMVSSGNDAATALAEYLGHGSEPAFVDRMNAHAKEIGLTHTRFADAAGLADASTTTALDMARLARHLLQQHPEILRYSSTKSFTYNGIAQNNYNTLLFTDPRVDGLKTGNIKGLFHMVATGKVGSLRLIAAVMGTSGDKERAEQAETLLDWGFRVFRAETRKVSVRVPVYKGDRRTVEASATVHLVVPKDGSVKLAETVQVRTPRGMAPASRAYLIAPVQKGSTLGTVAFKGGGATFTAPLKADAAVRRGGFFRVAWDSVRLLFRNLVHIGH
ncbi:MAG: D-alanyl-D-alanine carboxypeptidase [Clostridia bacterium]|nr:D-alanyl-D-alanine carboxypeptidase [Clostridia bacterium]